MLYVLRLATETGGIAYKRETQFKKKQRNIVNRTYGIDEK